MDGHEIIEVAPRSQGDPPAYGHQHKKPRLDEELRPNMADQPPTASPPMSEPINIIVSNPRLEQGRRLTIPSAR